MRIFGLLGKNIDYSFSRNYFSEKFKMQAIDAEYRNFDIAQISEFESILNTYQISGLNVTIPYKQQVIPFLDHLDHDAREIGAVNTIKFLKNGTLYGYNTDYVGFMESIKPYLSSKHQNALILGTGGASKAIAYALELLGIDYQYVSRTASENCISYAEVDASLLRSHKVIINCTPLGTHPNIEASPELPYEYLSTDHLAYDLVYNPSETQFMKLAMKYGARATNGLRMLEIQAEKAWEIWNR